MEDNDVLEEQIEGLNDELDTIGIGYNEWERDFISNMKLKLDRGRSFTDNEVKQIEKLYSKYISGDSDGAGPEDTYDRFTRRS